MLTIRLFRVGRKRQPAYKIVVTEKKNAPARGRFVEEVGFYDPTTKQRNINSERVKYWLGNGVQVSDTVFNMFVDEKIVDGPKRPKHSVSKKEQPVEEEKKEETKTEEKPVEESASVEEEEKEEVPTEEPAEVEIVEQPVEETAPAEKEEEAPVEEQPVEVETAPVEEEKKE
ncbi:MAG: 30S ribosomal protein S16 [Candidatus Pacebacteria bacterium]|nr:30S ribosomal protein S16 [Candidatus Paceibacterota bacterium]